MNNYTVGFSLKNTKYSRLPIIRTFKGNRKTFESSRVKLYRNQSLGNVLKGNENCFELGGGSSHRGFELLGVDCKKGLLIVPPKISVEGMTLKV